MTNKEWIISCIENAEPYQIAMAYCNTVSDCNECDVDVCNVYDIDNWMKKEHVSDQ